MNYPMSIEATAATFVQSGLFPDMKSEQQVSTLLIIGRGYNISDYDSVTGLYLRQGKINMHANVMASAIKASGKYDYEVIENSDHKCEIQFFRLDASGRHPIGNHTFSMEQAQRANLTKNFTWKQYPEAMLFARCISSGYRAHCPDALGAAPVYVEQHGEMEVDAPADKAPTAAQRAVPKKEEESTIVDESPEKVEVSVRNALLDEMQSWCDTDRSQTVKNVIKLLSDNDLPTDGSCEDMYLGYMLAWVIDSKQSGIPWEDLDDSHPCLISLQETIANEKNTNLESEQEIDF